MIYTLLQPNHNDSGILVAIYIAIMIVMVLAGFWILNLIIKQQRFPLPISFPLLLSLYLQRVPIDLLGDAVRIMQRKNKHVDLYRLIRVYLTNWDSISTAEDLVQLMSSDSSKTE
ncbi:hypothetical protein KS4_03750 [Poriferisphaera corsica]|uniref:Uncharacterized protein n=1 Tax=Poriferisphaera corsica TaxID=2528020 RepID=A0A517YQ44_9BACT|nr:hypothetical protein KS4_03750 [Poriferisphaera corsica]